MPQYIPYSPLYIPDIQPYKPDFNFLGNVAQTRQNRYDASYKKVSEMYGSLLNSPMLRDENIKKRDAFFKAVDQDIKKMAGMDLSLQQNQDAAMQVFKGLYEDKDIVKDMAWTKNLYNQMERGNALKLCSDPTKCDGEWWEGGDQELQYKAQEFKNASREEALAFENPEYTAHYNVENLAIKAAKDAGFNMKVDTVKGGWIVTNENGEMMQPSLADFFLHKFGSDPKVMKMYGSQAYLQRKNWVGQNLANYGGDENAANLDYVNQMMNLGDRAKQKQAKLDEQASVVKNNKALAEEIIKKDGYSPDIDENLKKVYSGLFLEEEVADNAAQVNKQQIDLAHSASINMNNLKYALKNMDQVVALNLLKQSTSTAATHFSNLTKKEERKADPYALATHSSNLALRNGMQLIGANLDADLIRKKADFEYKQLEQLGTSGLAPTGDGTTLEARPDVGGTGTKAGAINPKEENYTYRSKLIKESEGAQNGFVNSFVNEAVNKYMSASDNKQKEWLKGSLSRVLANTGIDINEVLKRNLTTKDIEKLSSLNGDRLNSAYQLATDYANPTKGGLLASKFFSKDFYSAHSQEITHANALSKQQQDWETYFENTGKDVSNKVAGDFLALKTPEGKAKADIVTMFTKIHHRPFSKEEAELFDASTTGKQMAAKYADEHWRDYVKDVNSFTNPNAKNIDPNVMMVAKGKALDFYKDNAQEALVAYNDEYQNSAASWRQTKSLTGKTGNALTSMAHGGYYDKDVPGEQRDLGADWFNTYQKSANNPNLKIAFGNANELATETDASAKRVADVILGDLSNKYKSGDANRPKFSWTAQEIAGGDPNYMAMTFYPDLAYMKKFEGTEKNPGLLAGLQEAAQNGVTMFFPKNVVDNKYTAKFKVNPYEYLYEATGQINLDAYGNDVNVKIEKTATGPRQVISYTYPGEETKVQTVPLSPNSDLAKVVDALMPGLSSVYQDIEQKKAQYRKTNGTKDINQVQ